jgi:outer membrane protein assembly factor BamB
MFMHDLQHTGRTTVDGPSGTSVHVKWQYKAKSRIQTSPTLGANNTVYLGAGFAPLCAVNASTGAEKWCTTGGGDASISSPTVASNGTVYIGARDNRLWAVRDDNTFPTILWKYKKFLDGDMFSSPALDLSGNAVYAFCGCLSAGIALALNPATANPDGELLWELQFGKSARASAPAIDTSNDASRRGTIYIGTTDGMLYALTSDLSPPPAGQVKWSLKVGGVNRNNSSPSIANDGTIYIGTSTGIVAVSSAGNLLWSFNANSKVSATPAIGSNGTIYFGTQKKAFYAVNPNGTLKWKIEGLSGEFRASTAIGANGKIYAAGGKSVYCFDDNGATGAIRWEFQLPKPIQWSSPAIGSGNTLYIGSVRIGVKSASRAALPSTVMDKKAVKLFAVYAIDSRRVAEDRTHRPFFWQILRWCRVD